MSAQRALVLPMPGNRQWLYKGGRGVTVPVFHHAAEWGPGYVHGRADAGADHEEAEC